MQNIVLEKKKIQFERAIFISWYCSLGDCTYCYMSTQKNLISDPEKAKRSTASILAEAYICKKLGWKVGNLAAGYGSYTHDSILDLCKKIYSITGEKFWLNVGVLPEKTLIAVKPYLEGIYGAVETVNEEVHAKTAPNKPIKPIEHMYRICEKLNLKKAMTFIVGMGETIEDFSLLESFILKNKLDKIVFYALNPIKGTEFEHADGPSMEYYLEWIKRTRTEFAEMDIVAGPWVNRSGHLRSILEAGANGLTKFPAIKLFNTDHAKTIEKEIENANYELQGTFTKLPEINLEEIEKMDFDSNLKKEIKIKVSQYLEKMNSKNRKYKSKII